MGGYITKEQWAEAMKTPLTPEEETKFNKAGEQLMAMSKEERRKFFQEAREKFKDEFL